jgi:hypothetical protein
MKNVGRSIFALFQVFGLLLLVGSGIAQETTAGLQGTVKDPSGAVVTNAQVVITASTLVGDKQTKTDGSGYYRFANLPPGTYNITVTAKGFATSKREGLILEVGHLPSVDFSLAVGGHEPIRASDRSHFAVSGSHFGGE